MSKLRSVNTEFWSDPFIEDLSPSEKLLYLYFITNEKTNMLGVYEVSIKKISFETGIDKTTIQKALENFERQNKVRYVNNYIILLNFTKHQNYNTNMKISAIDVYNNLPNELKGNDLHISKENPLEGFERVSKGLGMVRKVEIEYEVEEEYEIEIENEKIDFDFFWNEYDKKVGDKDKIEKKWNKLSLKDQQEIMQYIPNYKLSQPEKQYRKNPETFLNQKSWNDELIFPKEKSFAKKEKNYESPERQQLREIVANIDRSKY